MSDKTVKQRFICLGTAHMKGDTKGVGIQILDDDDKPTGDPRYYKKLRGVYAGLVYNAEFTLDEAMRGSPEFEGWHSDEEYSAAIKIQSAAVDTQLAVIRREKKANADKDDIFSCLAPLREAYHSTNYQGRLALEVQVLDYMRRKL